MLLPAALISSHVMYVICIEFLYFTNHRHCDELVLIWLNMCLYTLTNKSNICNPSRSVLVSTISQEQYLA